MLKFRKKYFVLSVLLFLVEFCIAAYADDKIIRPYIGDLFVVMLIYCFLRSFLNTRVFTTGIAVLIISYIAEILQYCNIIKWLGLRNSRSAGIIMGSSFSWIDLATYTIGILATFYIENLFAKKNYLKKKIANEPTFDYFSRDKKL